MGSRGLKTHELKCYCVNQRSSLVHVTGSDQWQMTNWHGEPMTFWLPETNNKYRPTTVAITFQLWAHLSYMISDLYCCIVFFRLHISVVSISKLSSYMYVQRPIRMAGNPTAVANEDGNTFECRRTERKWRRHRGHTDYLTLQLCPLIRSTDIHVRVCTFPEMCKRLIQRASHTCLIDTIVYWHFNHQSLQPADIGLPTGNGNELSCSLAQLGQATGLAVA